MTQKKYMIDNRTKEDVLDELEKLAASYVPEWHFDRKKPDIGMILTMLFAGQMQGNIDRFNDILERYHMEFVNLLDISLHPAHPASSIVLMNLLSDTAPDVYVEKRTRLLAEGEDTAYSFETDYPIYLTSNAMKAAFMTIAETGSILPVYGAFEEADYAGKTQKATVEEEIEAAVPSMQPFHMFDVKARGLEKHALALYHTKIFDVENETIFCRLRANEALLPAIARGELRFLYYAKDEGFIPVEKCELKDGLIILEKEKENEKLRIGEKEYGLLVLEQVVPQEESSTVREISFSSTGKWRELEYAGDGNIEYDVTRFDVFGDTLALYAECYLGLDSYFEKDGAKISMQFRIDYEEHYVGFGIEDDNENLKIVKRKPRVLQNALVSYANAEEITVEYYNGIGWKRLVCDADYSKMFGAAQAGECTITFACPEDWEPLTVGAYQGRSIRLMLRRADNCYLQSCIHKYPVISGMRVMYSYEDMYVNAEKVLSYSGTNCLDITDSLAMYKETSCFEKSNYADTALYLGFAKCFDKGPVSLYFELANTHREITGKLHFYYSTIGGFKEMKVVDYTRGLSRTGIMLFLPPDDMALTELEGQKLCWIKIVREGSANDRNSVCIRNIALNGVEVHNILTYDPEEYYLDEVTSNMSFQLPMGSILDTKVFVNEVTELSEEVMKDMLEKMPERVKVSYDYLGGISEFFVLWDEVDNFNHSVAGDRHYVIDRITNQIHFGDGIHVRIPRNTRGTAFEVQIRSCNGVAGNVPAGAINVGAGSLTFVGDIYNPEPAYGGSDMETLERALFRGANLISSGGRFVTMQDYLAEVENYSENIQQASIVIGTDRYGNSRENMLFLILLMKDYKDGAASFYRMQTELKAHLLEHCEMTVTPDELLVEEPIFVEYNVDVWAQIMKMEDSFDVTNLVTGALEEYLDPVSHRGSQRRIGELPRKSQIMMRLSALKSKAIIKQLLVTVRYTDKDGIHEMDLDQLTANPFMVACNGVHKIHVSSTEN